MPVTCPLNRRDPFPPRKQPQRNQTLVSETLEHRFNISLVETAQRQGRKKNNVMKSKKSDFISHQKSAANVSEQQMKRDSSDPKMF